jgi:hypothetical protein
MHKFQISCSGLHGEMAQTFYLGLHGEMAQTSYSGLHGEMAMSIWNQRPCLWLIAIIASLSPSSPRGTQDPQSVDCHPSALKGIYANGYNGDDSDDPITVCGHCTVGARFACRLASPSS